MVCRSAGLVGLGRAMQRLEMSVGAELENTKSFSPEYFILDLWVTEGQIYSLDYEELKKKKY